MKRSTLSGRGYLIAQCSGQSGAPFVQTEGCSIVGKLPAGPGDQNVSRQSGSASPIRIWATIRLDGCKVEFGLSYDLVQRAADSDRAKSYGQSAARRGLRPGRSTGNGRRHTREIQKDNGAEIPLPCVATTQRAGWPIQPGARTSSVAYISAHAAAVSAHGAG